MNPYFENRNDFIQLGKSMKTFAITTISILLIVIIGVFVWFMSYMSIGYGYYGYSGSYSYYNYTALLWVLYTLAIISVIVVVGLYIYYVTRLGTAARHVNNEHLIKSHRYLLIAIIWLITAVIIGIFIILAITYGGWNNYPTYYLYEDYSSFYSYYIMTMVVYVIILGLIFVIPLILNIIGLVSLCNWAEQYALTISCSLHARSIKSGANLVKWSIIGSIALIFMGGIVTCIIGIIIHLIGLIQLGNALEREFQSGPIEPTQFMTYGTYSAPQFNNTPQININLQTGYQHQPKKVEYLPSPSIPTQQNTVQQTTNNRRFCMYCGITFNQPDVRFCPQCGKDQV